MCSIKTVIIIGASGSVGPAIISALSSNNFIVSVLTREASIATFPPDIKVIRTDYSNESLIKAFQNQDAVVSAIATFSTHQQIAIVDAAVTAGVKRFIPSEYGIDTFSPQVENLVPPTKGKRDTIKYLKTKELVGFSWTAICVGCFFDWTFSVPGNMGWTLQEGKAVVFDGGDVEYEATDLDQIGRAVAAVLLPDNLEATKDRYIYVNSFTTTQNQVISAFEKQTGNKLDIVQMEAKKLTKYSLEYIKDPKLFVEEDDEEYSETLGKFGVIFAAIYGNGGFNNFSRTKGLWNERLGLPQGNMEESLARVLKELKIKTKEV